MDTKRIIVSLDGMNSEQAVSLAWTLSEHVWGFKVNDLITNYGVDIIKTLRCLGRVFADPKLHDTKNTVVNNVSHLAQAGADLITVHASGGVAMMRAAVDAAGSSRILAVTVLTSMDSANCQQVYGKPVEETVWDLAHLAAEANVHGIVCSPQEVSMLKHLNLIKVTPGVRPLGPLDDEDQVRYETTTDADLLVIGRPITRAVDPLATLQEIANLAI